MFTTAPTWISPAVFSNAGIVSDEVAERGNDGAFVHAMSVAGLANDPCSATRRTEASMATKTRMPGLLLRLVRRFVCSAKINIINDTAAKVFSGAGITRPEGDSQAIVIQFVSSNVISVRNGFDIEILPEWPIKSPHSHVWLARSSGDWDGDSLKRSRGGVGFGSV